MGVRVHYDSVKDFAPVILITNHPFWMLVFPGIPANSLSEFVALAKSQPGGLAYGSAGSGNLTHLAGEQFKSIAGVDLLHVPYKGGVPAITDTVAGRVALYIGPMLGTQQYVADKRLKVLAVTSSVRSSLAPDIPTASEAGYPGVDIVGMTAVLAPAGTPSAAIARLNAEVNRILEEPALRVQLARLAAEVVGGKPEQLGQRIRDDLAKWSAVVKKAGIKAD
jgi:tripartite-type tricarboxylate transporter receptor subunit TctC